MGDGSKVNILSTIGLLLLSCDKNGIEATWLYLKLFLSENVIIFIFLLYLPLFSSHISSSVSNTRLLYCFDDACILSLKFLVNDFCGVLFKYNSELVKLGVCGLLEMYPKEG